MAEYAVLNTGASMPLVGLGTGSDGALPLDQRKAAISASVEVGYRHFDTAKIYNSEGFLGEALKEAMEAGLVKREDFFVTSKLWCSDAYPDGVLPALLNSLRWRCIPNGYGSPEILNNPIIKDIASNHGKAAAQVVLRWGLDNGASVIPKSFNKKRMVENLDVFGWHLTDEDHQHISGIEQKKNIDGSFICSPVSGPYKSLEDLWDGEFGL